MLKDYVSNEDRYGIPYKFTAGKKAVAVEVNANFEYLLQMYIDLERRLRSIENGQKYY